MTTSDVVVLGPQRLSPTVGEAIASLERVGAEDRIATVTAGWEEREAEDDELSAALGGRCLNLNLFERAEEVFHKDGEVLEAMRSRHDRLRKEQSLYRLRLSHGLQAARELMAAAPEEGAEELLENARAAAIEAVRTLDAQHLAQIEAIHADFDEKRRLHERPEVVKHRQEIERLLGETSALCIAGGHVAILLNRMRLFGLEHAIGERPIVCWSAGAMALSERVIVFHDSPPQGAGDAEVLETGLGVFRNLVPLPHAQRRLRLEDPVRVALFARRFGPAACVALDENTRVDWDGETWRAEPGTKRLTEEGLLEELGAGQ